ncbi:hypothetical protein AB0H29_08265 [Streptomyces thermolilacinus]
MTPAPSSEARRTRCARCRRPVLRQLVGRRAALDVTADDEPLTVAVAAARREPNRLDWCLHAAGVRFDMRWSSRTHPADCPHPHVLDHQCTAPAAPPRAPARTTRSTPVPAGQLTL